MSQNRRQRSDSRKRSYTMSAMQRGPGASEGPSPSCQRPINVYGRPVQADLEAQLSPRVQQSPKSRFFDLPFGRRRTRQQSLNLDEDLGYPPAYNNGPPPSESVSAVSARSLPDPSQLRERFRRRTCSDAAAMLAPSSRRSSGLIVFLNTSAENSPRSPTFDVSGPNLPNGAVSPHAGGGSPRRPLYVDTQLANGILLADKRRSPVASMVEFMRGRNRTSSMTCATSSPQSVSARGSSSSCDVPMPSPRCRVPMNRYTRLASNQRSLDSGLDLTSPTISSTALLIKEPSLFSSFDSMTMGGAFDASTIYFESQEAVYSLFMKAHKCYDLIPTSSKLVVFDTHLPVRKAFYALIYNNVRAAPLYDSAKGHYVGMLTITDFIKILYRYYKAGEDEAKMKSLEEQEISHWRERFEQDGTLREFITIDPNLSLHRAVQLLCEHKVHRLPVLDKATGNISYILTHKRLMKFMALYMNDLPRPSFVEKTPKELGIGSWGDVLTIHTDTPLIEALKTFLKNRVSALPIVDGEGKVVDIYAKFDVISLAAEKVYENLDVTVHEALKHRNEGFEGVHCCHESDSLYQVIETIVRAEVHRLIATDSEKRVVGVVSLSDILKYLVLDHVAKAEPMDTSDYSPPQVFDTLEEEGVE